MDVEFLDSNGPLFYYRWGKEFGWIWGKKGGRSVGGQPETHPLKYRREFDPKTHQS